ncbi:caspase family protein [Neolewinella persica]|uniref:caspase family protein n=1 Tax=Neolewinella persica TaxID=70998 RepID=UPI0003A228AE|nr:caspase family protein [Neolewinella persica]
MIRKIDVDYSGKNILTLSDDKTAKLWNGENGALLRTLRVPIDEGNFGKTYAGAISPDGTIAIVGGWSKSRNHDLYIFDADTGKMLHRIGGHSNVILDIEFSPDGRFFAASLGGTDGIRVYSTSNFKKVGEDTDYGSELYNLAFGANGSLATVSNDGFVRRYAADFTLSNKKQLGKDKRPYSLDFSPDGQLLAVAYDNSPNLSVLDAQSLEERYQPDITGAITISTRLNKTSFSKDGNQLIAGGYNSKTVDGVYGYCLRIWDKQGKGPYTDLVVSQNTIMDLKSTTSGNILIGGSRPDWAIVSASLKERVEYTGANALYFNIHQRSHLLLNQDGTRVGVSPHSQLPINFDLTAGTLQADKFTGESFTASRGKLTITDWQDDVSPKLNNQKLNFLQAYEQSHSVDINGSGSAIVIGGSYDLYSLNAEGKKIWDTDTPATTWAVNIAPNGRVVVATHGDGVIRWYRMTDGRHLLSLFIHPDRERWVCWTPDGYYNASPGAEEFLGWHVNQGMDKEALFYPLSRFRDKYYRPDVVQRVIMTADVEVALQQADQARGRATSTTRSVANQLPPLIRILSPPGGSTVSRREVTVRYDITSPNGEPLTGLSVQIDGRPIPGQRGIKPKGLRGDITVQIPATDCRVSLLASNRHGKSEPASIDLKYVGSASGSPVNFKPNLYLLSIGVADYKIDDFDLDYSDNDARDFYDLMKTQQGLLYNKVHSRLLVDQDATKDNILDALDWLTKETTQHDVAMIFFAGHGLENDQGTFYYLPVGADDASLRRTALMKDEIRETVASVAGKIVVFMDACHSGGVMRTTGKRREVPNVNGIINELISAENGAVVFSSSTGRQKSQEDTKWQNGAFTEALLAGLKGGARYGGDEHPNQVTCKSLDLFISRNVKELTNGNQSPTTVFPVNVQDFPIFILPR